MLADKLNEKLIVSALFVVPKWRTINADQTTNVQYLKKQLVKRQKWLLQGLEWW